MHISINDRDKILNIMREYCSILSSIRSSNKISKQTINFNCPNCESKIDGLTLCQFTKLIDQEIEHIVNVITSTNEDYIFFEIIEKMMNVSVNIGMLMITCPEIAEIYKNPLSSVLGSVVVKKGRWDQVNNIKRKFVEYAEYEWKSGSCMWHTDMADKLIMEHEEESKYITRPIIINSLKHIAQKYGRLRGIKGVKKK